tara:strand:+ start:382 stop:3318 length:2937 start_codon:yes stop_codon:yes gene_type:complete
MNKYIYVGMILSTLLFSAEVDFSEKKSNIAAFENGSRTFRTGDYGLVCQNESGSYNTDMENYIYSPVIEIPTGDQVGVDFLVRGSLLDGDVFPDVDYWGMQLTADGGQTWNYVSNPYGDTSATAMNYVYSDAPDFWSLFSTTYSEPIDISNYAGSSIQIRYWFHSDSDAPQGEGLFLDDIAVNVDGADIYFESFEDSTMAGWVSVDETSSQPEWHTDTYGAYGESGRSWWMGSPDVGSVGGYEDDWYQVLDTPPVNIPAGTNSYSLTFDQKRAIEALCAPSGGNFCPSCTGESLSQETDESIDGWDAFNVRISNDGGDTWEILQNVTPSYNSSQNWAFGFTHSEGCGIPAWGGPESSNPTWENTEVEIPVEYNGQEIMIRFAFASDGAYSTEYNATTNNTLTGVWIDNIDIAGVFTNDGEDTTGFESKSLVALGGDLWHVDYIGVPPVIPMPENVVVTALDGSVEVSWEAPQGNTEYDNEWVSFDDGTFENGIVLGAGGQGYLGTSFDMPYGVESVTVHSSRVHATGAGTTTLAGFAVIGGVPSPTALYEIDINTVADNFTEEITLDWQFQSSFIIALLLQGPISEGGTDGIGLSIDESPGSLPSSNSWSNLGGWSPWIDVSASNDQVGDGEFGIQAKVTSVGGSTPVFNVYRDPGLDGSSFQLMFNGTGIDVTNYTDNIVSNGVEYCYRIASVYDEAVSEQTFPACGLPISNTVYEVIYDDGTSEDIMPVGNGNFIASKFTPDGYPSDLYASSFYVSSSQTGTVLVYVWDDNGEDGKPGDALVPGLPKNLIQGWNEINFVNEGFDLPIEEGSVYVGYQQLSVNFNIGVDWNNSSYASNSMLDFGIGLGWEQLSTYSPGGVWMIRAQMDGEDALTIDNELSDLFPSDFVLNQNYPNPFNPSTTLKFGLAEKSITTLEVFNILGESVSKVVDQSLDAGFYNFRIDMRGLASGMYFYRLTATSENGQQLYNDMKKMILLQ